MKPFRIHIRPEAEAELSAAIDYYGARRLGLGLTMIAEVDSALEHLRQMPLGFPIWREGYPYRHINLRRFPFVLFYTASNEMVDVVAFAHAKRRPGYWLSRM